MFQTPFTRSEKMMEKYIYNHFKVKTKRIPEILSTFNFGGFTNSKSIISNSDYDDYIQMITSKCCGVKTGCKCLQHFVEMFNHAINTKVKNLMEVKQICNSINNLLLTEEIGINLKEKSMVIKDRITNFGILIPCSCVNCQSVSVYTFYKGDYLINNNIGSIFAGLSALGEFRQFGNCDIEVELNIKKFN